MSAEAYPPLFSVVWARALRTLVDNDNVDCAVLVLRVRGSRLDNEAADLLQDLDAQRQEA